MTEHGIESAFWNNYGGDRLLSGWQIICICGYGTSVNRAMEDTGAEFDAHLKETTDDGA